MLRRPRCFSCIAGIRCCCPSNAPCGWKRTSSNVRSFQGNEPMVVCVRESSAGVETGRQLQQRAGTRGFTRLEMACTLCMCVADARRCNPPPRKVTEPRGLPPSTGGALSLSLRALYERARKDKSEQSRERSDLSAVQNRHQSSGTPYPLLNRRKHDPPQQRAPCWSAVLSLASHASHTYHTYLPPSVYSTMNALWRLAVLAVALILSTCTAFVVSPTNKFALRPSSPAMRHHHVHHHVPASINANAGEVHDTCCV